jgi:hypothetical protein
LTIKERPIPTPANDAFREVEEGAAGTARLVFEF